jgi:hypothetical protein
MSEPQPGTAEFAALPESEKRRRCEEYAAMEGVPPNYEAYGTTAPSAHKGSFIYGEARKLAAAGWRMLRAKDRKLAAAGFRYCNRHKPQHDDRVERYLIYLDQALDPK